MICFRSYIVGVFLMVAMAGMVDLYAINRSIVLNGYAHRHVIPDKVHIRMGIKTNNKVLKEAAKIHASHVYEVLNSIRVIQKNKRKIKTIREDIRPYYRVKEGIQFLEGYKAITTIDIILDDLDHYSQLRQLVTNKLYQVSLQLSKYSISQEKEIKRDLQVDAYLDAYQQAQKLAAVAGMQVGHVLEIQDILTPQAHRAPMYKAQSDNTRKITLYPAEERLEGLLQVRFELKPKNS